jgi:hypothetical protein
MRYLLCAVTVALIPLLAACDQSAPPTSPQPLSGSALASAPGGATDDVAVALGNKGGAFKGRLDGALMTSQVIAPNVLSNQIAASAHLTRGLGWFTIAITDVVNQASRVTSGTYRFTNADGDTFDASFDGQAPFLPLGEPVTVVETATIIGGTGRFAGASGSFTVSRAFTMVTGGSTTGSLTGTINLP